ncbi:MAG: TlpA family protein disulfide reductase [Aureliella sp.]
MNTIDRYQSAVLLSLFVGLFLFGERSFAEQPEMRLRLKDGSFSVGTLVPTDEPGRIGWQANGFAQPFLFDLDAIRSVSVTSEDAKAKEDASHESEIGSDVIVELIDGSAVIGQIESLNENRAVLNSSTIGKIQIARKRIATIGSAGFVGKVVFDGPLKAQDWLLAKPEAWDFEAGVLRSRQGNAIAIGRVGIPEKARVDLTLAWDDSPDFVLSFCTAAASRTSRVEQVSAAARLEVWDKQLALVREVEGGADIALVTDLAGESSRISLTVYIDQTAGVVTVCDVHGRKLDTVSVKAERVTLREAIHIVNHGNQLSLESLEVREWDGIQRSEPSNQNAKVVTIDGTEIAGGINSYDSETKAWQIQLREGGKESIQGDSLRRGDVWILTGSAAEQPKSNTQNEAVDETEAVEPFDSPADPGDFGGIEVVLESRERIRGAWIPSDSEMLRFSVVGVSPENGGGDVFFPISKVRGIVGSTARFDFDSMDVRLGTLKTQSSQLVGNLDPATEVDASHASICWKPVGSLTSSVISSAASGVIVYRRRLPRVKTRERDGTNEIEIIDFLSSDDSEGKSESGVEPIPGSREIKFRTGDAISGVVDQIDDKGMHFKSSQSESTFAAHHQIQEIELNPLLGNRTFSRQRLDRLMTVPRSRKSDPPTHLFLSVRGDLLRGRLVSLNKGKVEVEVRLEVVEFSTDQISKIIWLHDRDWEDDANGSPNETGEQSEPFLVHAITGSGRGLTFAPDRCSTDSLAGSSDLLGDCMVSVNDLSRILFGRDIEKRIVEFQEDPWILSLAQLPRVFMEDDTGGTSGGAYTGTASELVGKLAPEFSLKKLDGELFRLREQRGQVVVLDFWASWCGPCVQTMPLLESAVDEIGDPGVKLLAVNLQENDERILAASERLQLKATVLKDISGQVAAAYDANAIPQTVIIDRSGVIQNVFVGGGSKVVEQIKLAIERVLDAG